MYYNDNLNRTGSININGNVNTNAGQRDDNGNTGAPLFSQSYDPSMLSNQDWQQSVDDQLANYLALDPTGFTSQSLDSSFLNDAFGGPSDWQGWNDFGGSFGSNINHQQQQQQQQPFKHGVGGGGGGGSGGQQENLFLNLGEPEQQAILLSDPNFMRQQQLLQEQQREMQMRIQEHEQQDEMGSEQNRSNLSAMLDQTEGDNSKSADSSIVPSSFARQQQQQQQLPQAPLPPAQPSAKAAGKAPTRKEHNRRSYNGGGSLSKTNRANPIPISGKASSTRATSSSSVPTEIDHQRRLNELQARFRINYARKPNQRSQKPQPSQATTSVMSSSFSGLSTNQFAAENMLGTSMPSNLTPGSKDSSSSADAEAGPERRRAASLTIEQNPAMTTIRFSHPPGSSAGSGSSGKLVTAPRNQPSNPPPSFPSRTMPIQIQRVQRPNQSLPFDAELRQKKLDDQLEKVDFDDITVSELKEMLRQRGKPATGKKAILLQRLQEERDMIKAARSGRIPRQTAQQSGTECGRPKSFAGTVPIPPQGMPHPSSPGSRASSVPDSQGFIPPLGSPGSVTSSLNWSIENMHIGSPPPISSQQARRYAPYGNPSSPRLGSAGSPKMYSTSVPTGYFSSSPSQHDFGRAIRPYRYPAIPGKHKYAPHTSSALATPDHEEEINPFDQIMQQEAVKVEDPPSMSSTGMEGLQWDPPIEEVLQQGTGNAELGRLTEEELLSLLASQQFNADSMALDTPPSQKVQNGLDFSNVLFEDSMFDDSKGRQEWYK